MKSEREVQKGGGKEGTQSKIFMTCSTATMLFNRVQLNICHMQHNNDAFTHQGEVVLQQGELGKKELSDQRAAIEIMGIEISARC